MGIMSYSAPSGAFTLDLVQRVVVIIITLLGLHISTCEWVNHLGGDLKSVL